MWADMPPEVKLQSMSFTSFDSFFINSVKVTLSNGDTAYYYTNSESYYYGTINFDPDV